MAGQNGQAIVVVGAARTPVGSFNGGFANTPAHDLGKVAITEALKRAKVEPGEVDEVILGQILTAGQGQNPARQAAINSGIPQEATAWGLNQLCGSGLRAIAIGMQQITSGDAKIIVAGGQESMSMAPSSCAASGARAPLNDPTGVRAALTMTMSWDAMVILRCPG